MSRYTEEGPIILGTGSYENVKAGNTVSIDIMGGREFGYNGRAFTGLVPPQEIKEEYERKMAEIASIRGDLKKLKEIVIREYIKSYYESVLKKFNPEYLPYELQEKFGNGIILLSNDQIDRRIIADYIETETGIFIPEIISYQEGIHTLISPGPRYKYTLYKEKSKVSFGPKF